MLVWNVNLFTQIVLKKKNNQNQRFETQSIFFILPFINYYNLMGTMQETEGFNNINLTESH